MNFFSFLSGCFQYQERISELKGTKGTIIGISQTWFWSEDFMKAKTWTTTPRHKGMYATVDINCTAFSKMFLTSQPNLISGMSWQSHFHSFSMFLWQNFPRFYPSLDLNSMEVTNISFHCTLQQNPGNRKGGYGCNSIWVFHILYP